MKLIRTLFPALLLVALLGQSLPAGGAISASAATPCDAAQFIGDVTVPDGMTFAPGGAITKTWRLKNIGTCTWTTSYAIVFYNGSKMGAPEVVFLPSAVAPGSSLDITVNMTAPTSPGHYRGYWRLRNSANVLFGVGANSQYSFFIDINVATNYSSSYDFVANYCAASWSSAAGILPCPGSDGDSKGYVLKLDAPKLEDGSTDVLPGLVVGPQNTTGGFISGIYPAYTVQSGDRFQSVLSCAYNVSTCYVTFRLEYQVGSAAPRTLWSFQEKTEGKFYRANVDLSSLAGQSVRFILTVDATGSPTGDRATWGGARIVRVTSGPIPTPTKTPTPGGTCNKATWVTDVTVPDGTTLNAGTQFTKTWRVRNDGSCTWTTSYSLVFVGGDALGAIPILKLPTSVAPGQTIDLLVNMSAPYLSGRYLSYWQLRDAAGVKFGLGSSGTASLLADINVTSSLVTAYDLVANACQAVWSSAAGTLPCPGADGDPKGFVFKLDAPKLEDGSSGAPGLLTFPQNVTDGYIKGVYPAFKVQSGDRFHSIVNCQYGSSGCYVTFRLDYQVSTGSSGTLKSFQEKIDGLYYRFDIDLSSLAGQNVQFILSVLSTGPSAGDRAVWSGARLLRQDSSGGGSTPTVTGPVSLNIYFLDTLKFNVGTQPYETMVQRTVQAPSSLPYAALEQLFAGPTTSEYAAGLRLVNSGATGFGQFRIERGVAHVQLTGTCSSGGATYTIANLIMKNLKQFPEVQYVKIYDQNGATEVPGGLADSIPFCLEP